MIKPGPHLRHKHKHNKCSSYAYADIGIVFSEDMVGMSIKCWLIGSSLSPMLMLMPTCKHKKNFKILIFLYLCFCRGRPHWRIS